MHHHLFPSNFLNVQSNVLNSDGWFGLLSNKFTIFYIPLWYYYINLRLSIIFCLFSGNIYFYLGVFLSCSFVTTSELFCGKFFWDLRNFISNFMTNQTTSCFCCFSNYFLWTSFKCLFADCLAWSRSFWLDYTEVFICIFANVFIHILGKR